MNTSFRAFCALAMSALMLSPVVAQVELSFVSAHRITPNAADTSGAFARIYYHASRQKFYVLYSARQVGSSQPAGRLSKYAWREYDQSMIFTGNTGYLPGYSSAGDYAMVLVDTTYYHLSPDGYNYKLAKFDASFNALASVSIALDSNDSNMDQMLNYTNGKLILGAFHEPKYVHPGTVPQLDYSPLMHIFQYSLNLQSLAAPILLPQTIISWGASIIYLNNAYTIVTFDDFTLRKLYAFKYDQNFTYVNKILISNDGQWSQGLVYDGQYFYLAYHQGQHNQGNIVLAVYDTDWKLITSKVITNYNINTNRFNANRPYITKVGEKLYISYDIESYTYTPPTVFINQKDWQAQVDVYQITKTALAYTISGKVTGATNVTFTLSGGKDSIMAGSAYKFTATAGGTYTVTPSKPKYTFSPQSKTFSVVSADQVQDFTAAFTNRAPSKPVLVAPRQSESLRLVHPKKPITFSWRRVTDQDQDSLRYSLNLSGPGYLRNIYGMTDTTTVLDIMQDVKPSSQYGWSVGVSDGYDSTRSDLFTFMTSSAVTSVLGGVSAPLEFRLLQNYPNPFNPRTSIGYTLPTGAFVMLRIFDALGQEVAVLERGWRQAGLYHHHWDAAGAPSGVYFYRLQAGEHVATKVMTLLR